MNFVPVTAISTPMIISMIVLAVAAAALIFLILWTNKQQEKANVAQQQLIDAAQPMTLLVIDKKRMKIKDSNLPKVVIDNVPKRMRGSKVPIVKAKVGPQVRTFMCDADIFDSIPVKKEIRAMVGGIYIVSVKGIHGGSLNAKAQKLTFWQRLRRGVSGK